jgi:nitrilase
MRHIALESRCYVLGCNQFITKSMLQEKYQSILTNEPEILSRGGSLIVSPMGEILAGPLYDSAGILTAELDLNSVIKARMDFDVTGHYARNDLFNLEVPGQPALKKEPVDVKE